LRRPLSIALASLVAAALVVPTAQAATRRYDFQDFQAGSPGQLAIHIAVLYKKRHGRYTPRQAIYESSVPISCNPPVGAEATAPSGSYIYGKPNYYNLIKLIKGSFTYTYSSELPDVDAPGSISATATGKVIKKKRKGKKLRVDGSASILFYDYPRDGYHNCTSGGPVPYSATPCRLSGSQPPPYIKPSLPVCYGGA